jgi:hypothetical protein
MAVRYIAQTQGRHIHGDEDPDQLFLTIPCNWSGTSATDSAPQPAIVNVNRNAPILNHMEDFYCTCMRLSYSAWTVPAVIAPLIPGTNYSAGTCTWGFNLTYNGFSSGLVNVVWVPVNQWAQQPSGVVSSSLQSFNPYYWYFNFNSLWTILSDALQTAYNQLDVASGGTLPVGCLAPTIKWDFQRQSPVLIAQSANYDVNNSLLPIKIYFNNFAACLFAQFDFIIVNNNDPNGLTHYFNITANNYQSTVPGDDTLMTLYPQYFNPGSISPIDTFQCNTTLPVVYELVTTPNPNYGKYSDQILQATNGSNTNPSSNILIDIQGDYGSLQSYQQNFIYNKTDSTRYLEMSGTGALRSFQLNYTFTTYSGDVVPLTLIPGTSCIIKIAFIKKTMLNMAATKLFDHR